MYKKITTIEEIFDTTPQRTTEVKQEAEVENEEDVIKVDVLLMIRLLECVREDSKKDLDLYVVAKNLVDMSKSGKILLLNDYAQVVEKNK